MVTRLSKPLKRGIGSLVAEMNETHITVHRSRCQDCARVAIADLIAVIDQVRPPRGWIPQVGETVAVLANRHRAKVVALIPSVPEMLVRVQYPKGTEKVVELSRLVPTENSKVLVQCERIRRNGTTDEPEQEPRLF